MQVVAIVLTDTHRPELLCVPTSMQATVACIGSLTQHGSPLDVLVGQYQGSRFFTQQYINEVLTNLRLDGFPADHETVRAVLLGDREPLGVTETVAHNFHALMNTMGDYEGRAIDADLTRREASDADVLTAIGDIDGLNPCQAAVLKEAVIKPDTEFGIRAHQKRFDVVYSTARKDLADLADMGMLTLGYRASAYVYYPAPDLKARLLGGEFRTHAPR